MADADHDRVQPGAGQLLTELWNSDKVNFRKDQIRNGKLVT